MVGARWDAITTGLVAVIVLVLAIVLLIISGGQFLGSAAFMLLYGMGSGALAVVRSTMPLFYDRADFTKASSQIALPLDLISAASPPILAELLIRFGSGAVLELALLSSCGVLVSLALLRGQRQRLAVVAALRADCAEPPWSELRQAARPISQPSPLSKQLDV